MVELILKIAVGMVLAFGLGFLITVAFIFFAMATRPE